MDKNKDIAKLVLKIIFNVSLIKEKNKKEIFNMPDRKEPSCKVANYILISTVQKANT